MNTIPYFPVFKDISASMYKELYPFLNNLPDGISEFTFLNLYFHSSKHSYKISELQKESFAVHGKDSKGEFFFIMGKLPEKEIILSLLNSFGRWINMSEKQYTECSTFLCSNGYKIKEDRDNEDYLYTRESLANLSGKALHKKRNFANSFENSYKWEIKKLNEQTAADAAEVLDSWLANRTDGQYADYEQCVHALEMIAVTNQEGIIVYADGKPAGWTLGEYISGGKIFLVHFEKAVDSFRGAYQFVNRAMARALPETVQFINREQDLGDEGLRQAKMTYRPAGFVKKYSVQK